METNIVSLVSLFIALVAVCVAVWQVRASSRNDELSNELPIISEIMNEWRSTNFRSDVSYVLTRSPQTAKDGGFRALPARWREPAYRVGYFLDYIGVLTSLDIISDELVISMVGTQIIQIWRVLEPFIERERQYRRDTYPPGVPTGFLVYFEHIVARIIDLGGQQAAVLSQQRRGLRHLTQPLTISAADLRKTTVAVPPLTTPARRRFDLSSIRTVGRKRMPGR
jgi:hypothetical protein